MARANRLVNEKSPYLLQHARNPVDWYPWGKEAFMKAEKEDKPIFLSIGYSTCHWCHVMEKESFEDKKVAEVLNKNFVSIKVDREERPDIDSIYMKACLLMTGSGGWPLTIIMTPEKQPFFARACLRLSDSISNSAASNNFLIFLSSSLRENILQMISARAILGGATPNQKSHRSDQVSIVVVTRALMSIPSLRFS